MPRSLWCFQVELRARRLLSELATFGGSSSPRVSVGKPSDDVDVRAQEEAEKTLLVFAVRLASCMATTQPWFCLFVAHGLSVGIVLATVPHVAHEWLFLCGCSCTARHPCVCVRQEVDDLYRRALEHFNNDPILHIFAAQYYNTFRANHRIEQMHLNEAEVCRCPYHVLPSSLGR